MTQVIEPNLIALCRRVRASHTAEKLNWTDGKGKRRKTLIDGCSANLALSCWDAMSEANRTKFGALANKNPVVAINLLWRVAR